MSNSPLDDPEFAAERREINRVHRHKLLERWPVRLGLAALLLLLLAGLQYRSHGGASDSASSASSTGSLSRASSCADWNDAGLNAQSTYVVDEQRTDGLQNRWAGAANGAISRSCNYSPQENLGAVTDQVKAHGGT